MPFSRMMACARATRLSRSSTPIGGTSPRMFFIAASSASAFDPPTPTVMTKSLSVFLLSSAPEAALHQDIRRRRQPQGRGHQDEGGRCAERPVVELELAVDQRAHHPEFGAAQQHRRRIGVHAKDESEN